MMLENILILIGGVGIGAFSAFILTTRFIAKNWTPITSKVNGTLGRSRCSSCEHSMEFHQADGCWHSVVLGRHNRTMGCPCGVPGNTPPKVWHPGHAGRAAGAQQVKPATETPPPAVPKKKRRKK